jgi:hypothetical protein
LTEKEDSYYFAPGAGEARPSIGAALYYVYPSGIKNARRLK